MTGHQPSAIGTIALLGATGMLGQALCRTAQARDIAVAGLSRKGAAVAVDATKGQDLFAALDRVRPDVVVNAAALTDLAACENDPGTAYLVNADIVASLAQYCRTHGVYLVQVSTDHYFTGDGDRLHDESSPVHLLNVYARTKFAGEAFAATCPRSLTARTNIVGFRGWKGRPTFCEWALAMLESGQDATLFDDFFTSSIDVGSFSHALLDLIQARAGGLINLACRETSSKAAFVRMLAERTGLSAGHCRTGSVRALAGAPRAESLGLDVSKAETVLGRKLPDAGQVAEALARSYRERADAL
jgi:dTDP-4-dehydrorhamnose reductase